MIGRSVILVLIGLVLGQGFATPAWSQTSTRSELKARFEQRYPELRRLKAAATVGETWDGLVAAVDPAQGGPDAAVRALLKAENDDRRLLYRMLAEEIRASLEEPKRSMMTATVIAERNAWRNFEKASATEPLRVAEGAWVTKRERPWLLRLFELEDKGLIGETSEGYVGRVPPEADDPPDVDQIIERENDARRREYEARARAQGISVAQVARRQAQHYFKAAHLGVFLRGADGSWQAKREDGAA